MKRTPIQPSKAAKLSFDGAAKQENHKITRSSMPPLLWLAARKQQACTVVAASQVIVIATAKQDFEGALGYEKSACLDPGHR